MFHCCRVFDSTTWRATQWPAGNLWDVKRRDDLRLCYFLPVHSVPLWTCLRRSVDDIDLHVVAVSASHPWVIIRQTDKTLKNVQRVVVARPWAKKISLSLAQLAQLARLQQLTSFPCQLGRKNVFSSVKSHVRRLCTALDDYQSRQWLAITTTTSAVATTTIGRPPTRWLNIDFVRSPAPFLFNVRRWLCGSDFSALFVCWSKVSSELCATQAARGRSSRNFHRIFSISTRDLTWRVNLMAIGWLAEFLSNLIHLHPAGSFV